MTLCRFSPAVTAALWLLVMLASTCTAVHATMRRHPQQVPGRGGSPSSGRGGVGFQPEGGRGAASAAIPQANLRPNTAARAPAPSPPPCPAKDKNSYQSLRCSLLPDRLSGLLTVGGGLQRDRRSLGLACRRAGAGAGSRMLLPCPGHSQAQTRCRPVPAPALFAPWVDDAWPQIPLEELQSLRMAMADVFLALGHVAKTLEFYDHAKDKMPRSANVHFRYFAALE